jgi:hypothetical protein
MNQAIVSGSQEARILKKVGVIEEMFSCKDCVHYEVCVCHEQEMSAMLLKGRYRDISNDMADGCRFFKNKADFVEVKRGRWANTDEGEYMCTNCNEYFYVDIDMHPIDDCNMFHCPNCGADMRKEGADNEKL